MESEDDEVTKQIQEYYKKYSQDRKLPKYFSGTSVEYIPKIVSSEETRAQSKSEIADEKTQTDYEDCCSENKPISPSSSVTSNRKLEWDNGADIGYSNYSKSKLHKSNSLPALISNNPGTSSNNDPGSDPTPIITVINLSSSSSEVATSSNKEIQSSTSSQDPVQTEPSVPSSTTEEVETEKPAPSSSSSSNFSNTLAYLKSRIGIPDAESTPKLPIPDVYVETPKPVKPPRKLSKCKVQLCITKPINVECIDVGTKSATNKITQTSLERKCTKSVQTSGNNLEENDKVLEASSSGVTNQSVVLVNYDASESSDRKSSTTQTGDASEALASHCDSFEYLYGSRMEEEVKSYGNLKRSDAQRDLVTSNNSSSSKGVPVLGEVSLNVTNEDMEKNIVMLKRLLKSKKYDAATKKRYVKKIVKKIVEKDTSSSSSELFVPKQPESNDSEQSNNGAKIQQKLQQNVPWYPVHISQNLTTKTFSDEFLPGPSSYAASSSRSPRKTKQNKSIFTMAQQQLKHPAASSTSESHTSLEKQQDSSSQGYRNWKEDKTVSERVLENQRKGRGDQLVHFARKERQHQIEWINDEISHLSKLKGLLEKKYDGVAGGGVTRTRTTTVYVVSSSQRNSPASGSQRPCGSSGGEECSSGRCTSDCMQHNRNEAVYAIETSIGGNSPRDGAMVFNLKNNTDGTEYKVSETGAANANTRYIGNVEFCSDQKNRTTNITVRAQKIPQLEGSKIPLSTNRFNFPATYPRYAPGTFQPLPCRRRRPSVTTELNHDTMSEIKRRWLDATPGNGSGNRPDSAQSKITDRSGSSNPGSSRSRPRSPKPIGRDELSIRTDSDDVCQHSAMHKPPSLCIPSDMPQYQEAPQIPPFYLDDTCCPCGMPRHTDAETDDFSARPRKLRDPHRMPRTREYFSTRVCIPCGLLKRTEILSKKREDVCLPCGMPKHTEDLAQDEQAKVYKDSCTQDDQKDQACQSSEMPKNKDTQYVQEKTCEPCGMPKPTGWQEVFSKIKDSMNKYDVTSLNSQTESLGRAEPKTNKTRTVGCVCKIKPKLKPHICSGTQWSSESVVEKCTCKDEVKGLLHDQCLKIKEIVEGSVNAGMKGNLRTSSAGAGSIESELIKAETLSDCKSGSSNRSCKQLKSKSIDSSSAKAQTDGPRLSTRLSQTDRCRCVSLGLQSGPKNVGTSKSDMAQTDNPDLGCHVIQTDDPRTASNLIQTDTARPSSRGTDAQIPQVSSKGLQSASSDSRSTRCTTCNDLQEQYLGDDETQHLPDCLLRNQCCCTAPENLQADAPRCQFPLCQLYAALCLSSNSRVDRIRVHTELRRRGHRCCCTAPNEYGRQGFRTVADDGNQTDSVQQGEGVQTAIDDRKQTESKQRDVGFSAVYGRHYVQTNDPQLIDDKVQTDSPHPMNKHGFSAAYGRHYVDINDPKLIDGKVQTDDSHAMNKHGFSAAYGRHYVDINDPKLIDDKVQTDLSHPMNKHGFSAAYGRHYVDIIDPKLIDDKVQTDDSHPMNKHGFSAAYGRHYVDINDPKLIDDKVQTDPSHPMNKHGFSAAYGRHYVDINDPKLIDGKIQTDDSHPMNKHGFSAAYGRHYVDINDPKLIDDKVQTDPSHPMNKHGFSAAYGRHYVDINDPKLIDGKVQTDDSHPMNKHGFSAAYGRHYVDINDPKLIDDKVQTDPSHPMNKHGFSAAYGRHYVDINDPKLIDHKVQTDHSHPMNKHGFSAAYGRHYVDINDPKLIDDKVQTDPSHPMNKHGFSAAYGRHYVDINDPKLIDHKVQTDHSHPMNKHGFSAAYGRHYVDINDPKLIDDKIQTDHSHPMNQHGFSAVYGRHYVQTNDPQLIDDRVQTDNPNPMNQRVQTENFAGSSNKVVGSADDDDTTAENRGIRSSTSRKDHKLQELAVTYHRDVIELNNNHRPQSDQTVPFYATENTQTNVPRNTNHVSQTDKFYSKSAGAQSDLTKSNKMQTDNPHVSDSVIQTENASKSKRNGTECACVANNRIQTDASGKELYFNAVPSAASAKPIAPGAGYQMEVASYDGSISSTARMKSDCSCNKQPQQSTDLVSYDSRTTELDSESSSSYSSESSTSGASTCICCKRKATTTFSTLRKKLSQQAYPLCKPCFTQNGNWSPNQFRNPTHVCQCYTVVETRTLDEIKKTMNDIDDLDNRKCTCSNGGRKSCKHCSCKLRKTRHGKNGIAYMLTFEPESRKDRKKKKKHNRHKKRSLEEIKIKVPMYKKHKDKENKKKRERHERKRCSLQEYLKQNRPDFVEEAEFRRRIVLESKEQREVDMESKKLSLLKQLEQENNYFENNENGPEGPPSRNQTRRFLTPREILEINRRNYKKLPEVQQKLVDNRQKKLRMADKLIADRFNRNLRDNVLKGKLNLALDVCVV